MSDRIDYLVDSLNNNSVSKSSYDHLSDLAGDSAERLGYMVGVTSLTVADLANVLTLLELAQSHLEPEVENVVTHAQLDEIIGKLSRVRSELQSARTKVQDKSQPIVQKKAKV